jgi:segregation and condensation protein B
MADPMTEPQPVPQDQKDDDARRAIEAVLMVAEQPVEPQLLAQLLELPVAKVVELCEGLAASYEAEGRGFCLVAVAGGWRFQSHADLAPYVERFVLEGQSARLSGAALETLAIVAYKQPVSRAQVAAIRGVNVDGVMRTLQQRGFIAETGKDPGPGQAILFGTTPMFLERLGLNSLDELPPLSEFVPGADVVEHLEAGLRPEPGPSLGERLDEIEATNAVRSEPGSPEAPPPDHDLDEE